MEPVIAARTCEDCQKWWYDDRADPKTGKYQWSTDIVNEAKVTALANSPEHKRELMEQACKRPIDPVTKKPATPCGSCPKQSPELAHKHELSEKNLKAVEFYRHSRAMGFQNLTEQMQRDETLKRNFAICDEIFRAAERRTATTILSSFLGSAT